MPNKNSVNTRVAVGTAGSVVNRCCGIVKQDVQHLELHLSELLALKQALVDVHAHRFELIEQRVDRRALRGELGEHLRVRVAHHSQVLPHRPAPKGSMSHITPSPVDMNTSHFHKYTCRAQMYASGKRMRSRAFISRHIDSCESHST